MGTELILLGTCYAPYRELLLKNYDAQFGTSSIVNINGIIYGQRKSDIIGVLRIKMRMRHPISDALRWIKEKHELIADVDHNLDLALQPTLKTRKLVVQIERAMNIHPTAASFIYYKLYNLKDVYTPTVKGSHPVYQFVSTHDVALSEAFNKYLQGESLEFVVFDDTVPLDENDLDDRRGYGFNDIIGKAKYFDILESLI